MKTHAVMWAGLFFATSAWAQAPVRGQAATEVSPATTNVRDDIQKTFGFVPTFLQQVPASVLPGAWAEMKGLQMATTTALNAKQKELIGLAVAAQIPCQYCIYAHSKFAAANGATLPEQGEALAMGAVTLRRATVLSGIQVDAPALRADAERMTQGLKRQRSAQAPKPRAVNITDANSARQDIEQTFGYVPLVFTLMPEESLPGAWREYRDVELSESSMLSAKTKHLISLAVSSQVSCPACVVADTGVARSAGATDRELKETIAMAGLIRHWSTLLNGLQVDLPTFRRDIDRIVENSKKKAAGTGGAGPAPTPKE